MGDLIGLGSAQQDALDQQKKLAQQEADRARRQAEIALAEKKAKKGQEIANIKLNTSDSTKTAKNKKTVLTPATKVSQPQKSQLSQSLGLGSGKTGVQL